MYWKRLPLALFLLAFPALAAQSRQPASDGNAEYHLGAEDVVQIWVWKEPDLSTTVVVRPDGRISMPLIGEMKATDKTANQLQNEIKVKLGTYLSNPVVTVIVKEINSTKIAVLGQVRKPDVYKIRQKTTVLDAIALAGGFTEYAKRNKVIVIRNNSSRQQRIQLDLKHPDEQTGRSPFYLKPSDTVYVE